MVYDHAASEIGWKLQGVYGITIGGSIGHGFLVRRQSSADSMMMVLTVLKLLASDSLQNLQARLSKSTDSKWATVRLTGFRLI